MWEISDMARRVKRDITPRFKHQEGVEHGVTSCTA